ncbi:MAG: GreA/GreB family elongation factor [Methylophilaceae bacterium]|nr:GreA/GreB family elongation factor [Methylophilaceae bacterium]
MSRAFTKESDDAGTELPDRALSEYPNYVTLQGLQQLKLQFEAAEKDRSVLLTNKDDALAKQKIAMLERDMRYLSARQVNAIVAEHKPQNADLVLFGATIDVEDDEGILHHFSIVGEDEAHIATYKVSWVSPLAKALIGHKIGESVVWHRPAGNLNLKIIAIHY